MDAASGETIPMSPKDDAGDLVETSFLCMGLLCARQYFSEDTAAARRLRSRHRHAVARRRMELVHPGRTGRAVLALEPEQRLGDEPRPVRGWNECLITYLLAAAAPRHAIDPGVYHRGFAAGPRFPQRPVVLRHRDTAGHAVRRPAVLHALLVLRPRSARPEGSLRRLLGPQLPPRADQPCALHRQSSWQLRVTANRAGA